MVHKFKNKVESFLFSEMPVDSMDYERKGGCFVTISKGVILTILFVIFCFILGLLVFYTTKHAYQNISPITLEEFVENFKAENDDYTTTDSITPKHYRLIVNPLLNDTQNQFTFNGNVWITITASDDNTKTIELDIHNLDVHAENVRVFRSRILSDLNFQLDDDRGKRSAKLVEDDVSIEDEQFDILMNSTEWIESNATTSVEKASQEVGVDGVEEVDENIVTTTELNEPQSVEATELMEDSSSEPPVTEYFDYNNITTTWDGLWQNDAMLIESNPDDQTELQIDGIAFNAERQKLLITLSSALRKGHYYIVKVFFRGNMTNDYGLVYKSYDDGADSSDNFIAATITDPRHTSAVFPCFSNILKEVTFELILIRRTDHQSVSVSKSQRTQKITNDWDIDVYERTRPLKLNNFGFVVTNIEAIIVTVTSNLMLNSYFQPKLLPSLTFIDSEIPSLLKKLELYTNVSYPLASINFIGLPSSDNDNDIIEIKEGLVIGSESFFITHGEADKKIKTSTISHMIGKLWSQPWEIVQFDDQEWINEALPLQLQLMTDTSHTNNYLYSATVIEKRMESMSAEQSFIEFNLKEFGSRRLDSKWIDVAQSKGLYLLEMFENLLTEPVYRLGIQRFFNSSGPTNFIETFTNLTKDLKIDQSKSMEQRIQEWSHQTGYPLIQIRKNANQIQIQETEFGRSSTQFWNTRLTINNQTFWLQKNSMNFDVEDGNWLTVKSNGYFRVNYDDDHWNTILQSLRLDHNILSANERAILMDDALNLAKFNYLNYSIVEKLLECWNEQETEYLPWKAALFNLEFVYRNSIDFSINNSFNRLLRNMTQRAYQKIVRSPLGGLDGFPYKLKILIKKWSCQIFALPDCVADAKKDFQNLIINDTLQRSQRYANDVEQLLCSNIRFGDTQNWYIVVGSLNQNDSHNYNEALVYSLGCSTDHRILAKYFQLLIDKNYKDYAEVMFRSMRDNQIGQKYALEYLYTNFQELYRLHGLHTLKVLLKGISTPYDYKLLQLFFSTNTSIFTSKDKKTLAEIVCSINSTLDWKKNFTDIFNTL